MTHDHRRDGHQTYELVLPDGRSLLADIDLGGDVAKALQRSRDALAAGRHPAPDDFALVTRWLDEQDAKYGGLS